MCLVEECAERRHVRARHRRPAVQVEIAAVVTRRGHRREHVLARRNESGLRCRTPASSGPREENVAVNGAAALYTRAPAEIFAVFRRSQPRARPLHPYPPGGSTDEVQVGVDRVRTRVDQDHPDPAGHLDREALVGPRDDAAIADDDLAAGLCRVERTGRTQTHVVGRRRDEPRVGRVDELAGHDDAAEEWPL